MDPLTQREAEARVRSWGFANVFTWTDYPNAYYAPHTHSTLTTHLILTGSLTISFPDDPEPRDLKTYGPGARVDVAANRRHEVWMGKEQGCEYVIGSEFTRPYDINSPNVTKISVHA